MADWSKPTLSSLYTDFLTEVKNRDDDIAKQFDGTTSTNLVTGYIRWNSSINRWQKWNGTAWAELAATYALTGLSLTGNAAITGTLAVTSTSQLTGNVGVGMAAVTKLDVTGVARATALSISGTTAFSAGTISQDANWGMYLRAATAGAAAEFSIRNSSDIERLRIDSSGNVGIGINAGAKTHISGGTLSTTLNTQIETLQLTTFTSNQDDLRFFKVRQTAGSNSWITAAWRIQQRIDSTNMGYIQFNGEGLTGGLALGTDNLERLRIDNAGNVGIGRAANANNKLEVTGTINSRTGGNTGATSIFAQAHDFWDTPTYSGIGLQYWGSATAGSTFGITNANLGQLLFQNVNNALIGCNGAIPIIFATTATERLRMDANGNLIANSSVTGYWQIPQGTTAQRPTGAAGMFRYNTSLAQYEGHNGSAWGKVGGGATGGGSDDIFIENGQTVNTNYTITSGKNALSAGAITIASGITVTVPSGSVWTIV